VIFLVFDVAFRVWSAFAAVAAGIVRAASVGSEVTMFVGDRPIPGAGAERAWVI
jgi:hypothetical protein